MTRRHRSAKSSRAAAPIVTTHDSWVNPTTGVGGTEDKAGGFVFQGGLDSIYSPYVFSEMYEQDDVVATIVDALPDEAMRRGFKVECDTPDPKAKEAIQDWLDRMKVKQRVLEARKWARLHGGAATLIGSDDGEQHMPLQPGGNIHFITNFERDELTPHARYTNPLKPNFGEVSHYRIAASGARIPGVGSSLIVHSSRLLLFYGVRTTKTKREQNNGWGSSVLLRCIKAVSQFYGAFASSLSALADVNQNVYKIKDFAAIIKSNNEAVLKKRLDIVEKFRSSIRAIVLDADAEEFVRSTLSLTGIEGILDKMMLRLAAAAKMPVSVLMGQAPAGMNATGESDQRIWHARAETERQDEFAPQLTKLLKLAFLSPNGPTKGLEPSTWSIQFPPLWEPTAIEAAQIDAANATTDSIYLDKQVLLPSDIAKARFRGEQNNRVLLNNERIAELEEIEAGGAEPVLEATPGAPNQIAPTAEAGTVETTDEEDTEDESIAEFAQRMTELGAERCEHNRLNRCLLCGIERVRTVDKGPDGSTVFGVAWRPIGAKAKPIVAAIATTEPAIVAMPGAPNAIAP